MRVKFKVYEVETTGDEKVVREALAPLLAVMGVGMAPVGLGERGRLDETFLAAHGFTVADYQRGMREAEDVEAFVARRELEQAGVKFTRRSPGDLGRAMFETAWEKPSPVPGQESQAAETLYLAARRGRTREDWLARTDEDRAWYVDAVRGLRPHPDLAVAGAPTKPTGCGLYPTEKGEAVPAPTPKRKPRKDCAACGKPAVGGYEVHRDGYGKGPKVGLCSSHKSASSQLIWEMIARQRKARKAAPKASKRGAK